ncbi:hypothetical protein GIB67_039307 [Kingdonia uniflora]|uniref:EF-hand domain-containing protein n=1 Tax=Kingdonia uniflora TaxID=39325 RepID=A0A7J7MM60_9MAGN|nr:hypothetical protein GIB67_039307 [Kingdonia uniflora]
MQKKGRRAMARVASLGVLVVALFLLMNITGIQGRFTQFNSSELVSDGVEHIICSPLLLPEEKKSSEDCEHMYGFLPCTDNLPGHLFQIVLYEYLLFLGERYVSSGSELLFNILGPGYFGASVFHVLGAFPEAIIVFVSGLSKSKETAQEHLLTGVGLLAGSTILLLTLIWGTCIIVGKRDFTEHSASKDSFCKKYLSGSGISTDRGTTYTAWIMALSVVPFIVLQVPRILKLSSGGHLVTTISLILSIVFLLNYFLYQVFNPWIQLRRLEYVKHEHFMVEFLKHVERQASGKILTDDGVPNLDVIRRIFEKTDVDKDDNINLDEMKELILEIKSEKIHLNNNDAVSEIIKDFDFDNDHKLSKEEFINGFVKWLAKNKHGIDKQNSYSKRSIDDLYREKMEEYSKNKQLVLEILRHAQSNGVGDLVREDGAPNIENIESLFEKVDVNGDNSISIQELRKVIQRIKFGNINLNKDDAVKQIMKELDKDGDQKISKDEFVDGLAKWLESKRSLDDFYQEAWKETDKLVDRKNSSKETIVNPFRTWIKSISLLLLGIAILFLLAEPLIDSVQKFSKAASIPPFFISFILIPLATKFREASSAIKSAGHKKRRITSLAFSEIYGGVFMNNMLGLTALLSLVYARGLTWDFSAEVTIIIIICAVMGTLASFCSKFPLWTCIIAYLLYPLSLVLVYVLDYVLEWS